MKNAAILIALFIGLSTTSFATDGEKEKKTTSAVAEIISYESHSFRADLMIFKKPKFALHFKNGEAQKLTILLTDQNGTVLHYDRIRKTENLSKTYLLDGFPAGTYKIEVSNGETILQKEIEIFK